MQALEMLISLDLVDGKIGVKGSLLEVHRGQEKTPAENSWGLSIGAASTEYTASTRMNA